MAIASLTGPNGVRPDVSASRNLTRYLFVLTAHDKASLETQVKNLEIYLEQRPDVFEGSLMRDLAYTLGERRSIFPWRIAASATLGAELIHNLTSNDLSPVRASGQPKLGFVYTGQGAQWFAMGRELFVTNPIFMSTFQRAADIVTSLGASWSLIGNVSASRTWKILRY